jgi:hypothetical protein
LRDCLRPRGTETRLNRGIPERCHCCLRAARSPIREHSRDDEPTAWSGRSAAQGSGTVGMTAPTRLVRGLLCLRPWPARPRNPVPTDA